MKMKSMISQMKQKDKELFVYWIYKCNQNNLMKRIKIQDLQAKKGQMIRWMTKTCLKNITVMILKRKMGLMILIDRKMKKMKTALLQEVMMIMAKSLMMKKMLTRWLMEFGLRAMSILERGLERMIFLIKILEGCPNSIVTTKLLRTVILQISKINFKTSLSIC